MKSDTNVITIASIYFVTINALAFMLFGLDKALAKRGMRRVPETTLLGMAAFGGSLGAYAGMWFFHHKTRKAVFRYGIPAIVLIQTAIVCIWRCL